MIKKILLLFMFLIISFDITFATDACVKLVPITQNFYGKVTMIARLRDYPCVTKSNTIGSSKIGDTYKIVSKVDGWYKIESNDGKYTAWIWDQAITKLYDYTPSNSTNQNNIEETVNSGYILNQKDKELANKTFEALKKKIDKKGILYKNDLEKKLEKIVGIKSLSPRTIAFFENVLNKIKDIEIKTNEDTVEDKTEEIEIPSSENSNLSDYNIDFDRVKKTWLGWNNTERSLLGKYDYGYNLTLEKTAFDWSETSRDRGEISHKRDSGDGYYDYAKITNRLKERGVVCKNVNRVTHTENIGRGSYYCSDSDCTDELINGIKTTFDFYMSEKDESYQPHYKSLMNDYFKEIGMGIAISKQGENYYRYYLTVHYCTELVE